MARKKGLLSALISAMAAGSAANSRTKAKAQPRRTDNEPGPGWYPIKIVGESGTQERIAQLEPGDWVDLVHDVQNRFDDRAVKVVSEYGRIGYLERESWLKEAVIDVGWELPAKVLNLYESRDYPTGVTLQVKIDRPALREAKKQMRAEKRAAAKAAKDADQQL